MYTNNKLQITELHSNRWAIELKNKNKVQFVFVFLFFLNQMI